MEPSASGELWRTSVPGEQEDLECLLPTHHHYDTDRGIQDGVGVWEGLQTTVTTKPAAHLPELGNCAGFEGRRPERLHLTPGAKLGAGGLSTVV